MNLASDEVIRVLTFLLPGFVGAAVFYSLTSHPKPGAFDRVIHALIYTVIAQETVQALVSGFRWSKGWEFSLSVVVAVVLALIAVVASNYDAIHRILRTAGVTRKTSYPSVWYSAFSQNKNCYVVLHLKGERYLYGWPKECPGRPNQGHLIITDAAWLDEDNKRSEMGDSSILIPVSEVEMVEFVKARFQAPSQ